MPAPDRGVISCFEQILSAAHRQLLSVVHCEAKMLSSVVIMTTAAMPVLVKKLEAAVKETSFPSAKAMLIGT